MQSSSRRLAQVCLSRRPYLLRGVSQLHALRTSRSFADRNSPIETSQQVDKDVLSAIHGTPLETLNRKVRIFLPTRVSTQSGINQAVSWRLVFPEQENLAHWTNPLMGWTATRDPNSNVVLKFETKEQAIAYCKQNGYEYEVEEGEPPYEQINPGKDYADNFKYKTPLNVEPDIYS